jgi:hypothetical protein
MKLRQRGQIAPVVGVVLVVAMTLGNAAANLIPVHRPTAAELQREEQREVGDQRRQRIAELQAAGDKCWPATAHEYVRLLAFDGQFKAAHAYADDYIVRCGFDPVVRHWGDAHMK